MNFRKPLRVVLNGTYARHEEQKIFFLFCFKNKYLAELKVYD